MCCMYVRMCYAGVCAVYVACVHVCCVCCVRCLCVVYVLYVCMRVHTPYVHECGGERDCLQVSSSITLHFIIIIIIIFLNKQGSLLELKSSPVQLGWLARTLLILPPQKAAIPGFIFFSFLCGYWGSNSGPPACMRSTLPASIFPGPESFLKWCEDPKLLPLGVHMCTCVYHLEH